MKRLAGVWLALTMAVVLFAAAAFFATKGWEDKATVPDAVLAVFGGWAFATLLMGLLALAIVTFDEDF